MPFTDDPSIADDVMLVRVLRYASWAYPKEQPTRPASVAFFDSNGENSCFIVNEAEFDKLAEKFPDVKYGAVAAGQARAAGFYVSRDDDGADGLAGHVILGFNMPDINGLAKYRKAAERLAKGGSIYVPYLIK
jgi:hypothetical protein